MTAYLTTGSLLRRLKLEEVPAHEVQEGDIIWAQGYVVVAKVDMRANPGDPFIHPGSEGFIEFNREVAPQSRGYERSISVRPKAMIKRVPQEWVRELTETEKSQEEGTDNAQ